MSSQIVNVARCPEHGLHGERTECFACGAAVEQIQMVPVDYLLTPAFAERVLTFHLGSREAGMADSYRDAITKALDPGGFAA